MIRPVVHHLGARASRPHPVPLAPAELQCDAAGSHPVGGNSSGQAEGDPWRRSRLIQVGEMSQAVPGLVRARRPRSREAFIVRAGRPRSRETFIVRAGRPRSREAIIVRARRPRSQEAIIVRAGRPRSREAIIVRAGRPRSRESIIP